MFYRTKRRRHVLPGAARAQLVLVPLASGSVGSRVVRYPGSTVDQPFSTRQSESHNAYRGPTPGCTVGGTSDFKWDHIALQ